MNNAFSRSRFMLLAGTTLVAGCAGTQGAGALLPRSQRRNSALTNNTGDPPQPLAAPPGAPHCTSVDQDACIDDSGLYRIGRVRAKHALDDSGLSIALGWVGTALDADPRIVKYWSKFYHVLGKCVSDRGGELSSWAFGMATYLQSNWAQLSSATDSLRTYVGVYLAGGATAIEMIGACASVLSVGDFAILVGAVGLSVYELMSVVDCQIQLMSVQ